MSEEIVQETKNESQPESDSVKAENGLKEEVKSDDKPAESEDSESKTEASTDNGTTKAEPSAELLQKIKKQVEFYFGDVNMQRDRFLVEQVKLDDGWVPMTVMLNFKILASLSKDIDIILKSLEDSELIEISEDKKKIRRSPNKPLPTYDDGYRKAQEARTVYLKGFPLDTTIETLKSYYESNEAVENIIMRKYKKGKDHFFKGSIFLQFKTLDDAKAFMEQETVKYNDTTLLKLWSAEYVVSKEKERDERRQKKALSQLSDKVEKVKGSKNQKSNVPERKFPKGCVIQISDIKKDISWEDIKSKVKELEGEVAYVDYSSGDTEGWIRLQGENSATELLTKLDSNKLKIKDCDITCKLLEGDEEEAYLTKIQESMANHRQHRRDKGRNGRKNFKRRHSPHKDGNAKKSRADD